jgi:hypothetical protein
MLMYLIDYKLQLAIPCVVTEPTLWPESELLLTVFGVAHRGGVGDCNTTTL